MKPNCSASCPDSPLPLGWYYGGGIFLFGLISGLTPFSQNLHYTNNQEERCLNWAVFEYAQGLNFPFFGI